MERSLIASEAVLTVGAITLRSDASIAEEPSETPALTHESTALSRGEQKGPLFALWGTPIAIELRATSAT